MVERVRRRARQPLPLRRSSDTPHLHPGRRIRVVLDDQTMPLPVFHGDLPLNAPPAYRPMSSADGCAVVDVALPPDAASTTASTQQTSTYAVRWPA
jgi:hypothetical protein